MGDLPEADLEEDKCTTQWDLSLSFIDRMVKEMNEWGTESTSKAAEYTTAETELKANITKA